MYQCRCRALTRDGQPFYFTAKDVPVQVYPDEFILAGRPGTPVLKLSSMHLAMDHLPLAVHDRVLVAGTLYTVTYVKGFTLKSDSGVIISSDRLTAYTLHSIGQEGTSKVQFKYGDCIFQISSLLGCFNGGAALVGFTGLADPEKIQISAGFSYNKQRLFFGGTMNGDELIMWRGRPCVQKDGMYVEVPTGELLGGVNRGWNPSEGF